MHSVIQLFLLTFKCFYFFNASKVLCHWSIKFLYPLGGSELIVYRQLIQCCIGPRY